MPLVDTMRELQRSMDAEHEKVRALHLSRHKALSEQSEEALDAMLTVYQNQGIVVSCDMNLDSVDAAVRKRNKAKVVSALEKSRLLGGCGASSRAKCHEKMPG